MYVTAESLGGSGFIAAFVGGLATAASGRDVGEAVLTFTEAGGEILNLMVFSSSGLWLFRIYPDFPEQFFSMRYSPSPSSA